VKRHRLLDVPRRHGGKIPDTEVARIRDRLAERPDDGKAVMRLVAAREYKAGLSPAEIERKYGWPEGTVYHWLDYIEQRGLDGALRDRDRSGRPPKLSDEERDRLLEDLRGSPENCGYDHGEWIPALVDHHLETEYGVEYSIRHVRRLMNEAGISWPRRSPSVGTKIEGATDE
jgi:transposase